MTLRTLVSMLRSRQLGVLLATSRAIRPYYRLSFLGAGIASGWLGRLAAGPLDRDRIAVDLRGRREGLEAWLGLGVWLGELRAGPEGYSLRGRLARKLVDPAHDAAAALVQEAATLHHRLIVESPRRLRDGEAFTLADQDGALVARSSRVLEPIVREAVEAAVPPRGAVRLLEIGCGSGIYIRHAAARNPALTALGLELQPEVATMARENVASWGLADRVTVEVGDVRRRPPEPRFDLATLHNNIYYFPVDERTRLLRHVRGFLVPGGRLFLTTLCLGKGRAVDILNLWGAMTEGCGRLPEAGELVAQMHAAGFTGVRHRSLIPRDSFHAFTGVSP